MQNSKNQASPEHQSLIQNPLLTPREIAHVLGISSSKAYALLRRPDFPSIKIGRNWRIDPVRFRAWLERGIDRKSA